MLGLGGEVFVHLPGRRGFPGGGTGAQIGAVLARKSLGSGHGWLGGAWGGCCERVDSREEIFGLLNFCCTREVVLFLRGGFI